MKKITILTLHLGHGGIERCVTSLANTLSKDYEIEIVSTYKLLDKPAFDVNKKIKIRYLMEDIKSNRHEFINYVKSFKLIKAFKEGLISIKVLYLKRKLMIKTIKECSSDVIISTRDIHNKWLGKYAKKNIVKIGWEHNHHNDSKKYINKVVKSVSNLDYFILVSKNLKEYYEKVVKIPCIYIPNSLDEYPIIKSSLNQKNIISVGRLSIEKGYSDLIDIFKIVNKKYPDWHLDIVGDGPEYKTIENKIKNNNLNTITLHGFRDRKYVNNLLLNSSIYVMTSLTESFGIVLLEAFSYGVPCIAFSSAQGANEIISNNWDGFLVDDRNKEKMAKKIIELIKSENRRIIMGNNAVKKANEYNIDNIKNKWLEILPK